jgi:hypothetical protein
MEGDFVLVPVPLPLVAEVMRRVAAHLEGDGIDVETEEDWGQSDPWAATDEYEGALFWTQTLSPAERDLLRRLTQSPREIRASDLAEAMQLDIRGLSGLVGPLNRRCSQGGWPPAVVSRTVLAGPVGHRRRIKVLSVTPALRALIERGASEDDIAAAPPPRVIPVPQSQRPRRR